ncbi:HXXEE domain-containing protein [Hyphomicrobium sp. NDB2Meth4]|uniref:HXXEE domain-containing protein n=1 Tax=Hyphomicrobium sp. NDB2Meth4 TaxID=1892846 RepID=UPI0009309731|nr:HXXEE domain-containing protein [Hyphomicrobium sp. NDB2Meth4]
MPLLTFIANNWQRALPALAIAGVVAWLIAFHADPSSERALFAALLVIYMVHQTEEHLWPGGFRQFTNARLFKSSNPNWPVDIDGVALVNIVYVWVPLVLAVIWPDELRWIGLGWVALTLVNGIIHVVTTLRFRVYNPGLVTSIVLFLPFTLYVLYHGVAIGAISGVEVAALLIAGVLLHIPVAALFALPYMQRRQAHA